MRRRRGLTARLILAFVVVTVVTAGLSGIPGVWLVQNALDRQARAHAADARRATAALIQAEQDRLVGLAELAGQRPTLQQLLQNGQAAELAAYLQTLQQNTGLDVLSILEPGEESLSPGGGSPVPVPAPGRAAFAWDEAAAQVVLLATASVEDSGGEPFGIVVVGQYFDASFLRQVARQTGAEQTIVRDGQRLETSLAGGGNLPESVAASGDEMAVIWLADEPYLVSSLPLTGESGPPLAALEIALPIGNSIAARQRAFALVAASTTAIALLGGLLGALIARSLTRPLAQLTQSAHTISEGNLKIPVPIPVEPDEVATLATALEKSRASIQQTMEELFRAKVWAETLIQSIVEGVVTFDTAGQITFFSDGAARILGCQRDEALGQPLEAVFRPANGQEADDRRFFDHIPPRGKRQQVEIVTPDGRPMTLALTGERLVPPESDDVQVALVFRDVTEEEAARNLRSHILANITHEFRTPLAALNASLELLADHPKVARAGVEELLTSMQLGVLNLQTLINNLLESSSIEAGRFDLRLRPTDLNVVLAEAVQVVRPLLTARGQTLALSEPAYLPQVQADPARLVQVFINLLSNASKYGPPGSTIDLTFEVLDNTVKVTTADRGPGIPEEELHLLFRRFVRLGQPDDHSQYGIGLGLAVVKSIVEGHGGKIGAIQRTGGGAEFWFTIRGIPEEEPDR
jgi:two-component system phosphate regulon sensor histidine kinase PhoR